MSIPLCAMAIAKGKLAFIHLIYIYNKTIIFEDLFISKFSPNSFGVAGI
jgi:hypothetical protein